jgi:hypothetical protein
MTLLQSSPFLREQRQFPNDDVRALSNQVDHAYIDIAQKNNLREIAIYATGFQTINGQSWYLDGGNERQQALRQVYQFTAAGNIPHGLNWPSVSFISPLSYGSYTDGTNWYGVIYASSVTIAGQVSFYVTPTNIVVLMDSGAPAITSGIINLEWVSQV